MNILRCKIEPIKPFKLRRDKAAQAYCEVIAQQEAILLDFVTSGAMIRDLAVERGQAEWVEVEPMLLQLRQEFRVV